MELNEYILLTILLAFFPDLFALNRGTAATLDRKDARNGDIDKDVILGLNANDLSRKPATAYDFAFCFSSKMIPRHWNAVEQRTQRHLASGQTL